MRDSDLSKEKKHGLSAIVFIQIKGAKLVWSLIGIWVIGLCIATISSRDVLEVNSILKKFVELLSNILPTVKYSTGSSFPQVAMLYWTFITIFYPFYLLCGWKFWCAQTKGGLGVRLQKDINEFKFGDYCFLILFAIPFFSIFAFTGVFLFTGADSRLFSTGTTRLHLGLIGMFIPLFASCCIAGVMASVKKIIFGKI